MPFTENYRISVVHKGEYNNSATYVPLDEVSYNGSTYRNKEECTGVLPTNTTNWNLVSSRGDTGGGIVTGGTSGQIYTKQSNTDYDAAWEDAPSGLPTATAGQIPVYNGTDWVADSQWIKSVNNIGYPLGNVGIGTTSPGIQGVNPIYNTGDNILDVVGASGQNAFVRVLGGNGATKSGLIIGNNDAGKDYGQFTFNNATNQFIINQNYASGYIGLAAGGRTSDLVILATNGNVGIGTTVPTQKAHVDGNLRVTGSYYDSNNSPGTAGAALVSTVTGTGWKTLNKVDVGLNNVDNTSDVNKPISTATQTALNAKQATLVSGTNIKTINGTSVLGSGDITISGGSSTDVIDASTYITDLTGATNMSTGLQNAINAAQAANKPLWFPRNSKIRLESGVTFKVGRDASNVLWGFELQGNNVEIIPVGGITAISSEPQCPLANLNSGREVGYFRLSDMYFNGSLATAGIKPLYFGASGYFDSSFARRRIENITMTGFTVNFDGITFHNSRQHSIENLKMERGSIKWYSDATNNFSGDTYINGSDAEGLNIYATGGGICRGIHLDNINIYRTASIAAPSIILKCDNSASQVGDIWFDSVQVDNYQSDAQPIVLMDQSNSGKIFQIYFTRWYASGMKSRVVYASSESPTYTYGIQVTNCIFQFEQVFDDHELFTFNNVGNLLITDNQFVDADSQGTGDSLVAITGCNAVSITNNIITDSNNWSSAFKLTNTNYVLYSGNIVGTLPLLSYAGSNTNLSTPDNESVTAVIGTGYSGSITNSTNRSTGTYIDLPPGKWKLDTTMNISTWAFDSGSTQIMWVRTFWSDSSTGGVSGDIVSGSVVAGNKQYPQTYQLMQGSTIINNTSGAVKRYYYVLGTTDVVDPSGNRQFANFAGNAWGENGAIATRLKQ